MRLRMSRHDMRPRRKINYYFAGGGRRGSWPSGLLINDRPGGGRPRVCVDPTDPIASCQAEQLQ